MAESAQAVLDRTARLTEWNTTIGTSTPGTKIAANNQLSWLMPGFLPTIVEIDCHIAQNPDKGLALITALNNLKRLDIGETETTEEGVAQLRRALPKTEVRK